MKNGFNWVFSFVMVVLLGTTTVILAATPQIDTLYTIQLGTFQDVEGTDFEPLRSIGYLYAENAGGEGLQNVFLSQYETRAEANRIIEIIKDRGFGDAFVTPRPQGGGTPQIMIQLTRQNSYEFLDWTKLSKAGPLFMELEKQVVKVMVGPFEKVEAAKQHAATLQDMGFEGAFAKVVNSKAIHPVTQFHTIFELEMADLPEEEETEDTPAPEEYGGGPDLPLTDTSDIEAPTYVFETPEILYPKAPGSVGKGKRQSIKGLQQFLKGNSAFVGTVDGKYNAKTAAAVSLFSESNGMYKRYGLIAAEKAGEVSELTELEATIAMIETDSDKAYKKLEEMESPVAKAYRAYILFMMDADVYAKDVNGLMNRAIDQAYEGFEGEAPFDYKASYAYDNLNQLVLHTRYIQAAVKDEPAAPCWLFLRHKAEAESAYEDVDFNLQYCHGFMEWPAITLLKTISTDLNPDESDMPEELLEKEEQYRHQRNRLFLIPRKLKTDQEEAIVAWNDALWKSLDTRINKDRFFAKFGTPFKMAYHKAWMELEDYYLEKGFESYQSNALALAVLQTVVGTDVQSYLEE